ncbi:hypothetical protein RQM47_08520 [Rubrivirga sp. S365]|uniref:Zinc-finger n=1 Tax=Rubrivirga litoralis TaxID=3075598 RepID=A0ABU3BPN5_9BACT|nr:MULTISPECIES: hypothetical protein [unclassified Rubrivirga]MDT0631176.1 hypothetical protein [Rubrivirga sp. F394]MDT7856681.1 hypothetical protein [Rubrivirga sp. S365]
MTLTPDVLRFLVRRVFNAHPGEIPCGDCYVHVDHFAEMELAGLDAAAALPLVEEHLQTCPGCREEFACLVAVLRDASQAPERAEP